MNAAAVHDLVRAHPVARVQAWLRVGAVSDPLEAEADAVAERVLRMPSTKVDATLQRCPGGCPSDEELHRQPFEEEEEPEEVLHANADRGVAVDGATAAAIEGARGGGVGLPVETRRFFEPRFGADFSGVRVHADERAAGLAAAVNARAFTIGRDVFFGAGQLRPGTPSGDRLVAHELAHTLQQGAVEARADGASRSYGKGPAAVVQRQMSRVQAHVERSGHLDVPADPVVPAPTETEGEGGEVPTEGQVQLRRQPVQQIIASCDDDLIAFHTLTTTYLYQLIECEAPLGEYTADVRVTGNRVRFLFPEVPAERGRLFHFRFNVRRGQEDPATLLSTQDRVPFRIVAGMPQAPPAPEEAERGSRDRCAISIPGRELLEAQRFSRPLFERMERKWTLWEKDIPLGEFGWVSVVLAAHASAEGTLAGGYGPLILRDVCLFRSLGEGRFAGDAQIDFPANLRAQIDLEGGLDLRGEWLSVVPLGSAEGRVDVTGVAGVLGRGRGRVEVIYDNTTGEWALAVAVDVTGLAELGLDVDARAAIKILGRTLWSNRWAPMRFRSAFRWHGGVRLGEDLSVEPLAGGLQKQAAAGPGETPAPEENGGFPLGELLEEILSENPTEEHHEPPREGLTPDDALPFQWYKPRYDDNLYPRIIDIPNAIHPTQLERDAGPTIVSYPYRNSERSVCIGVNENNWARLGYRFQYLPERGGRQDPEKNALRDLLKRLGVDLGGRVDVDHVHELQAGGQDCLPNLWPMDMRANRSAGTMHLQQFERFEGRLGSINGRWFEIVRVSLEPGTAQTSGRAPTVWATECDLPEAECPLGLSGVGEGPTPEELSQAEAR